MIRSSLKRKKNPQPNILDLLVSLMQENNMTLNAYTRKTMDLGAIKQNDTSFWNNCCIFPVFPDTFVSEVSL